MNDAYCKIYPNEHFPNKNNDLYFKKVAKQKVKENMIKGKKYKYNITLHNRTLDNINYKLTDYNLLLPLKIFLML